MVLCLMAAGAFAQDSVIVLGRTYFNFAYLLPEQDLRERYDRADGTPFGFNTVGLLFNPRMRKGVSPVLLGVETSWSRMGVQNHPAVAGLEETVTKTRYNGINLVVRLEPRKFKGALQPFVDIMAGSGIYTTTTKLKYETLDYLFNFLSDEEPLSRESIDKTWDASFQRGLGIGVRSQGTKGKGLYGWNIRVVWVQGQNVDVCRASQAVLTSATDITYPTRRVRSGFLSLQFGLSLLSTKP